MRGSFAKMTAGLILGAVALMASNARAETQTENIVAEQRTYVFLQVAPAAAQAFLPAGWTVNPAAAGATKDANLILVWIDRKLGLTTDGKPLQSGTNKLLVVLVPSKNTGTGEAANMVVAGTSADPAGAPGAYKAYGAGAVNVDRVEKNAGAASTVEETWLARGPDGNEVNLRVAFTRGVPAASSFDMRIHSAAEPSFYRIYRGNQVVDTVRSVNTGVNRVSSVALKASGSGKLSAAINGSEKIIAINAMPFYRRLTFLP
ncbi:MAG: hypothetical protein EXR00_09445 [Alphaproteobacteria bacterium]|nr:hypothetical protein [Alphaproteobacteria bacterium]